MSYEPNRRRKVTHGFPTFLRQSLTPLNKTAPCVGHGAVPKIGEMQSCVKRSSQARLPGSVAPLILRRDQHERRVASGGNSSISYFLPPISYFPTLHFLLTFPTLHSTLGIRHSTFGIRHSTFDIRHLAFDIRHSAFGIRHSTFGIRHSAFRWCGYSAKGKFTNSPCVGFPPPCWAAERSSTR